MTALALGLARLLLADGELANTWRCPGGLLYFADNELRISTRRYLRDTDVGRIARGAEPGAAAGGASAGARRRRKLHRLEAEMLRRLAQLERD